MKIKKYEGTNEQEVMERVKDELGPDALILNVKRVQPKGIFALFRKTKIEISAAYENNAEQADKAAGGNASEAAVRNRELDLLEVLAKKSRQLGEASANPDTVPAGRQLTGSDRQTAENNEAAKTPELQKKSFEPHENEGGGLIIKNQLIKQIYDTLIEQDVLPELADKMFSEFAFIGEHDEADISAVVRIIYNTIVKLLGEPDIIDLNGRKQGEPQIAVLVGSTGVGKTTTIAKLTADFILKKNAKVALITADTYRVAAVEQLKTYADIMGLEVGVVYSPEDMELYRNSMKENCELLIIDTAGRSHKNAANMSELNELLRFVPEAKKYLTISLTTKLEDMLSIIDTYDDIGDFSIIYTKLDETMRYGSILNVGYKTGKKISYIASGQNVPDDIHVLTPEVVAKALLGLGESK